MVGIFGGNMEEYIGKDKCARLYFYKPTQVLYATKWNNETSLAGIAYCEEIIQADGSLVSVWDLNYLRTLEWLDLEDAIRGDFREEE